MRQTAFLVVYIIRVNDFAAIFNCTPEGQATDLMKALAQTLNKVGWNSMLCLWSGPPGFKHWIALQCSSVSVRVLLLSTDLESSLCWILIYMYMFSVWMHRCVRSPSRGPNNLFVYEPQQNIGRGLCARKTGLRPQ